MSGAEQGGAARFPEGCLRERARVCLLSPSTSTHLCSSTRIKTAAACVRLRSADHPSGEAELGRAVRVGLQPLLLVMMILMISDRRSMR